MSQALIDMEISHEEFIIILKEKDKYEKMKDNLRSENEDDFFFLCKYKMLQISKKEYKKCQVEIIDKERCFWVNRKNIEVESDVANWAHIFDKWDPKKQKYRHELMPNTKFQQYRVFV